MKTRDMVLVGVFAAIICIFSPFSVPVGPIPISLASFAVYIAAAVLGAKRGTMAVCIYVLIGAFGLPVFSGFTGGFARVAGVTGGYIIGYIFCAFAAGIIIDKFKSEKFVYPLALSIGTIVLYVFGTAWFMANTGNGLMESLMMCVIPFLIGDAVKIVAASAIAYKLKAYNFAKAI